MINILVQKKNEFDNKMREIKHIQERIHKEVSSNAKKIEMS